MVTRQLVVDSVLAAGLLTALVVVFVVDRRSPPPPEREIAEGEDPPDEKRSLLSTGQPVRHKPAPRAGSVYADRAAENRIEIVKKRGGSPISEAAVGAGLDWLSRHQASDASWSSQCLGKGPNSRCERGSACSSPGMDFCVAQTGLALLAFQGGGHFWFNETQYSPQVKRGLDWLISTQQENGQFLNPHTQFRQQFMYEHAIATFALAEACALAKASDQQPDPRQQDALERAVKFIAEWQDTSGGGWRYSPGEPGDASVSGWVVLALKSAIAADVKVNPAVLSKCIVFFKGLEASEGRTNYVRGTFATEATTGVGMLVHHFLLEQSDSPLVKAASKHLAEFAQAQALDTHAKAPDYYLWYNCTLGMFLAGGQNWDIWNSVVREAILRLQAKTGCERGSWPPSDRWGTSGGRIYSTSLAILTLEVYYRFAKKPKEAESIQGEKP